MPLALPSGERCFVDSNVLFYSLVPTAGLSDHCVDFLCRIASEQLEAYVTIPVLGDTLHAVMMSEAAARLGLDRAGILKRLKRNPQVLSELIEYPKALPRLLSLPLNVMPVDEASLSDATEVSRRHLLFTNDALIVAVMRQHQIHHLVTNDDDFDRVPDITVWKPRP